MPPIKVCPECCSVVNYKKCVCECGHCFTLSRKRSNNAPSQRKSKRIAMQSKRASESACETTLRQTKENVKKAQKRALETEGESWQRKQSDKICKTKKRGLETDCETFQRQMLNAKCTTRKRALETDCETLQRQMLDRERTAKKRALVTDCETLQRQMLDRERTAKKRALETDCETLQRQMLDRERTAKKRALEPDCETLQRQMLDRERTAKKRALVTDCETLQRQMLDRERTAKKRALESDCEKVQRQMLDRECTSKKRALASHDETSQQRSKNKTAMSKKRALSVTLDKAIDAFLSKTKNGPEFVCVCCNRMMYRQTVLPYNKTKYTKASNELLEQVFSNEHSYVSSDGKQWVCKTCDGALSRGNMPAQAKANSLQLCTIPTELSNLNALELRLISLRVPFMKMVALPSGKQRCIHGPAVNVPSKLDSICTMLPRLPSVRVRTNCTQIET